MNEKQVDVASEAEIMINLVAQMAREKIDEAIKSGAIVLESYPTDVLAGKVIAKAALNSAMFQYLSLGKGKAERDVKNLANFV